MLKSTTEQKLNWISGFFQSWLKSSKGSHMFRFSCQQPLNCSRALRRKRLTQQFVQFVQITLVISGTVQQVTITETTAKHNLCVKVFFVKIWTCFNLTIGSKWAFHLLLASTNWWFGTSACPTLIRCTISWVTWKIVGQTLQINTFNPYIHEIGQRSAFKKHYILQIYHSHKYNVPFILCTRQMGRS